MTECEHQGIIVVTENKGVKEVHDHLVWRFPCRGRSVRARRGTCPGRNSLN